MDNRDAPPPFETSPWGPRSGRTAVPPAGEGPPPGPPPREPLLSRRRWPAGDLILVGLIALGFVLQLFAPPQWTAGLALFPQKVLQGDVASLVGHMFLHAGIVHILFNLSAFVALAGPVHAALGDLRKDSARSTGVFLLLFLASGLAGAAFFVALNLASPIPAVGASGAICGLWGLASRVAGPEGELLPLRHPHVGKNIRNFIVMNLVIVLLVLGLNAVAGGATGMAGVAWEAHVGGFLVGLFAAPVFQRLARGRVLRWRA